MDVVADRGVGADVGVLDAGAGADHGGAADDRAGQRRARLDHDPALDPRVLVDLAVDAASRSPRARAGWPPACRRAGRCPSTSRVTTSDWTRWPSSIRPWIASVISSSPRQEGSRRAGGVEDRGAEEVDADQGEVRGRVFRLLDQAHDPLAVELGDAVGAGVVDRSEQDQRVGLGLAEGRDEAAQAVAQQVVAEVHDEGRAADELLGGQHRVGEPGRLVLDDVGDLRAEGRAVAGRLADLVAGLRRDDDPDLRHPGVDQRLDPVEEHGLVGDGHELLRRGVGDRAQAGAGAAREDQALEVLHGREGYRRRADSPQSGTQPERLCGSGSATDEPQTASRQLA